MGCSLIRLQGGKKNISFFSLVTPHHESAIRTEFFATPVQGKERWVRKSEIFLLQFKISFLHRDKRSRKWTRSCRIFHMRTSLQEHLYKNSFEILRFVMTLTFEKFATTLADILFVELTLHITHAKQMCWQRIHLSCEKILWIQIADEVLTEIPGWQILAGIEIRTCNLPTQIQFQLLKKLFLTGIGHYSQLHTAGPPMTLTWQE